ncbi:MULTISPECIES: DUF302 domain-containing protein [Marinobacter]|jgi:uncharacterized protein (DUF302 family)|uniref:Uncharacterized protein (DUF302 family) n=1 Tax=Marinobacter nauticus TaxID=2743 RepID=A0A368XQB6_MARNT|nr:MULTISPECIES: DUF302 domain-containing protein [Marinobacter]MCG8523528.1 DUF302 domain-containing protein [Pseudomonadales bacterium]ERS88256.1 hypothetical protein Q672_11650 [Marinobacter sp. EVN1]MBW3197793.1 DUF302 domain-containing protein [Marinobacter nauticus]MBY6183203.1 DUF302 domain-containing protein [Marinobacter nauticus]MBY6194101.1 DUF302 domain-containing protein [Marinobacter nauticus]
MFFRIIAFLCLIATSVLAKAADGLIWLESPHSPKQTMDKLEAIVKEKGLKVFARIDHAQGAEGVGESLRPTELLIFGNPKGGTPLMQCAQTAGIDLPLKALVWEDEDGKVWLGYNDPQYLAERHGVPDCVVVNNLLDALAGMIEQVIER